MAKQMKRVLLRLEAGLRQAIDPGDIFLLEAVDDDTHVRTRRAERLVDVRTLGELEPIFRHRGFLRIHRNYVVNLERVRQVRRRRSGDDWELKLAPPVNRVLPISRAALSALWKAYGEEQSLRKRRLNEEIASSVDRPFQFGPIVHDGGERHE